MKSAFALIAYLGILIERILTLKTEDIPYWNLNGNDQVAITLYKLFRTEKSYNIQYSVLHNSTKILSNDYFSIKEFQPGCKSLTLGYASNDGSVNTFTSLCNKSSEFFELDLDSNGKITSSPDTKPLFKAEDGVQCLDSVWSKTLGVYALLCYKEKETLAGFYYIYIVDRTTKLTIGFSKIDGATLSGSKFDSKPRIRDYVVNKGNLKSDTVFIAYNKPFPDGTSILVEEKNRWFLLLDVDPITKKPELIKFINFAPVPLLSNSRKMLSLEVINKNLYVAHFSGNEQIMLIKCTGIDVSKPNEGTPSGCTSLNHQLTLRFGSIDFIQPNMFAFYDKPNRNFSFCELNEANTANVVSNCKVFGQRNESDIEFDDFELCTNTGCELYYWNKEKTMRVGIDKITFTTPNITLDRFKTLAAACRHFKGKFYSTVDSFIEIYDNQRTEEMVLQSRILNPDQPWDFELLRDHEGKRNVTTMKGYRNLKLVHKVIRDPFFPKMIGFLGKNYRMPLGRTYFVGNKINFEIQLPDGVKGFIQNINDAYISNEEEKDEKKMDNVKTYFHSYGYQSVLLKSKALLIMRCYKKLDKDVILRCRSIQQLTSAIKNDQEDIIGTYETQQLLLIVTNQGGIIIYDKILKGNAQIFTATPDNSGLLSVTFKVKDSVVMIAAIQTVPLQVVTYELNLYDSTKFVKRATITSYPAGPGQESGGEFCPVNVKFGIEDDAILNIINSCDKKDRRIVRFDFLDSMLPKFVMNQFLRVAEFKQKNLVVCPDTEVFVMAAPGTNKAVGIGYESPNLIMDLGLEELRVKEIKNMVCLTNRAFGIIYVDDKDVLNLATYFNGKMAYGNNRLHSVMSLEGIGKYVSISGSEGNGLIVYTIYGDIDPTKSYLKAVLIDGPDANLVSERKMIANDALILGSNGVTNGNFDMRLEFHPQKSSVTFGNRGKKFKLENKGYPIDTINLVEGPVFDMNIQPEQEGGVKCEQIVKLEKRLSGQSEFYDSVKATSNGWLFASKIAKVKNVVFILMQKTNSSSIWVDFGKVGAPSFEVVLGERCSQIDVLEAENYVAFLSCYFNSQSKFLIYEFKKDNGNIVRRRYSAISLRSLQISAAPTPKRYAYSIASIDDRKTLTVHHFDIETDTDNKGRIEFYHIHTQNNVQLVKLIASTTRINILYFHPYDTMAQLRIINPISMTTSGENKPIVTTSDDTNMASFECEILETKQIACLFTTYGPNSFRIIFREDLANGLIEDEKTNYQLFHDNYPIKSKFNKDYFGVLTMSPSVGKPRLLIFKNVGSGGTSWLWQGLNYESIPSDRPIEDIDFQLTDDNRLLVTTNFRDGTAISIIKVWNINDAVVTVLNSDIKQLAKCKIQVNTLASAIGSSYIPASHIFLHRTEQGDDGLLSASRWYHWVLMILFFVIIGLLLYYFWKKELLRRQKLKEDSLCHNLGGELNF